MRIVRFLKPFLLAAILPSLAGAATQRFVVQLSTEPAARFASRSFGESKASLIRPEVQKHRDRILAEQEAVAARIQDLGGRIIERTDTALNSLIIELPGENAAKLSAIPGIKSVHPGRRYRPTLDQASIVHKFPQAYAQIGGSSHAGAGIKIAMIDTGIDITQPAFSDAGFVAPAGFPKTNAASDTTYTNNKVIVARSYVSLLDNPDPDLSASDESGHGTSTSDIAAGEATVTTSSTTLLGGAPGAFLGSYKVFGTPGINDAANDAAILKAIDDAVKDGMDVINYSLGSFPPIPASQSAVAQALNNAVAAGVIVAAAAGNDGNGDDPGFPISYVTTDGNGFTIPQLVSTEGAGGVIEVGGSSNQRALGPRLAVGSSQFLVDGEDALNTDNKNNNLVFSGVPIVDVATLDKTGYACNPLPANSLKGVIALMSFAGWDPTTDNCNSSQMMTNAQKAGAVAGIIFDYFYEDFYDIYNVGTLYGEDYFGATSLPGGFITLADGLALKAQLKASGNSTATLDFNTYAVPISSDRVAFLSSRGPNADFEIKPDLVAVGEDLYTATETINSGGDFYDPSGLLYPANGTSGATPLVSGAAAVIKAARPGLTALQYRSLIINSAAKISDAVYGGLARVMDAGAGLLDVNAALNAEATVVPASLSFGKGGGSTTQNLTITNIGTAADTFTITVTPRDPGFTPQISATSLQIPPGGTGTVQVTIPGGGLTPGEYEGAIHIQGVNTTTDTHVMYWFGVPSATPYLLTDMGSDSSDARGQLAPAAMVFRLTDPAGLPVANALSLVKVTFAGVQNANTSVFSSTGNGAVGNVYALDSYSPGTIAADVTLDTRRNYYNVFTVTVGDPNNGGLSLDLYILGQ
jgi:minor extracellular serine protease Vpr